MATVVRRVANAATTVTHTFEVGETPTDPTGTPTYTIVDANGTAVSNGNATVVGGGTGQVTAPLAAQTSLRLLTVTWSATVDGVARVETDLVEIVAGFYFTLGEGRASDASLVDPAKYTTEQLERARTETELECELICNRSFLPRYARVALDGTGTDELVLRHPDPERTPSEVRTLRRVSVAPALDETFVDLTSAELNAVAAGDDGVLRRTDGQVWTWGRGNVVVEFELGYTVPPTDLVRAALVRFRSRLNIHRTGIPDRAASFTSADGGTYRLTMPEAYRTGLPEVDAVYERYSRRSRKGKSVPASRTLAYDPQRYSLFHGRGY